MTTLSPPLLKEKKARREKISMVTAYDYPSAVLVEQAGIDLILVGDSLGMTIQGLDSTLPVTLEDLLYHTRLVTRGAPKTMVITDMPFLSCHLGLTHALTQAGRLVQKGRAQGVKIEGGREHAQTIAALVAAGIPVLGHLGLTPQSVCQLGGYKVQGKTAQEAAVIVEEALILQDAGIFALVLECVPAPLAAYLAQRLEVPVIGIGAGADCDGQVLVWHDLLGLTGKKPPRFVKPYARLHETVVQALKSYKSEVEKGHFPQADHSFGLDLDLSIPLYGGGAS